MDKREQLTPLIFVVILIILVLDFAFIILEHVDYEERKEYGNSRWQQVEETLHNYDKRIKVLEELLNK